MRTLFDSVTARDIPGDAELVAGYVDGRYAWTPEDWRAFPKATHIGIAALPSTDDGDVLDVETGDATPAQAPAWVEMRRAAGADPTVYVARYQWEAVREAFASAKIAEPHYWVADWTGEPHLLDGSVATQYANPDKSGGHFDLSVVADSWPAPADQPAVDQGDRGTGADDAHPGELTYTVQPGDSLSTIAERFGLRWVELWDIETNRERISAAASDHGHAAGPDLLYVGTELVIPAHRAPADRPAGGYRENATFTRTYTIEDGDTLTAIAERFGTSAGALYADDRNYRAISEAAAANGVSSSPDRIYPGTTLYVPAVELNQAGGTYTVQDGDTLSSIAAAHGTTWAALWAVPENETAIAAAAAQHGHAANPDLIYTGTAIAIPGGGQK